MTSPARRVAQALDALRHGWPIALEGALTLLPAETGLGEDAASRTMLISAARAVTLKLANQREAAVPEAPVLIRGAEPFDLAAARALADPALDLAYPLKGPFLAEPLLDGEAAAAAMELARLARSIRANVNLIRWNEVDGLPYLRPDTERVHVFQDTLRTRGVNTHIRASRGRDIKAACGQLRHESRAH